MRWSRKRVEPEHVAPERHEPEPATPPTPLVWEGRLPVVPATPVRIAARRASELAAEADAPHAA